MRDEVIVFITAVVAGAVASVTGFGIGSLTTPVLALSVGTKLAIAIVSIPHFVGTAIRFFMLHQHVDRRVLLHFGIMSAAGGLIGALLHAQFATPALTLVFGIILIFAGAMGASGFAEKMRFHGATAWISGGISGLLGGLVGNQGGIRSAALLGFDVSKTAFVATATAIGLIVDLARMPVYFWSQHRGLLQNLDWILITTIGVVAGTLAGSKLLNKIDQRKFRRVVSAAVFLLGLFMLQQGLRNVSSTFP